MAENLDQPRKYDAVLGGQAPLPADGAVLGGLAGVKQRLAKGGVKQRIDALLDAFQYGQEGLDLVIQALEDTSSEVCSAAYSLLQDSTEPRAKKVLSEYNPYKHFKCIHTLEGHTECLLCLAISPDGKILVSGCYDIVKVWNLRSGQIIHTLNLYRPRSIGFRIVISPDFQTLVSDYDGWIEVWDLWTGQKIRTFEADYVGSLAITPDGQTLICGGSRSWHPNLHLPIKMWNLHTGELVRSLHGHTFTVNSVIISSDGQTLVSQSYYFPAKVWDLHTSKELNRFNMLPRQPWIDSLAISPNGQKIVSGSRDGSIKVWDVLTDQIIQTFQGSSPGMVDHIDPTPCSAITPDGKILVAGSGVNNTIKVWNVQTGQELCTLQGLSSPVMWITISHDRQTIVSYTRDKTINVWGMP